MFCADNHVWFSRAFILSMFMLVAGFFIIPLYTSSRAFDLNQVSLAPSSNPTAFLSTWDTTRMNAGSSASNSIKLPLVSSGTYNFNVAWGDGTSSMITAWNQAQVTHVYTSQGVHALNITGTIDGWAFNGGGDCLKLIGISQWGCLQFGNTGGYFYNCTNLVLTATDAPNFSGTTSLSECFCECTSLGNKGSMNTWDVSHVTDMGWMFGDATSFNQPIGAWNVSRVTNMLAMFHGDVAFNQPLASWNVFRVTDMDAMFEDATSFNQPIGSWNVSSVTDLDAMFGGAPAFNQPIDAWSVSRVHDIGYLFSGASSFNQPLDDWDVSHVTFMRMTFNQAWKFDQPIDNWNVSSATDMQSMFYNIRMSTANYEAVLVKWSNLHLQQNVVFNAGSSRYNSSYAAVRASIISKFNWTINDAGLTSITVAPYNLDAQEGDGQVTLTWTAPWNDGGLHPTHYCIYIGTTPGSETLHATAGNATSYTVTGLSNGQTYYFKISAINGLGESPLSEEVSATPYATTDGYPTAWILGLLVMTCAVAVIGTCRKSRALQARHMS